MRILKAIAVVMDYPDASIQEHGDELAEVFAAQEGLEAETRQALVDMVRRRQAEDLFELQADYVGLFDRSRSLSLHLFEHVHGESRDRGQAMVELQNLYREQGLELVANELPDYVPLFLEFCSRLTPEEIQGWMEEVSHLLQLLHGRLAERESDYQWLFKALLELSGQETADEQLQRQLREEERDDTPDALDAVWAEEPVTFGPEGGSCGGAKTNQGQAVPVDWSALKRNSA
ncbi:nitrate reductase molybdenum cofactor assembly chaperone [Aquisalimonas lutea]|uniref:nitrate reductase molybdenum cofactor assembly chaperone n=1 Tax=Aquisalimonas lutea TaxID=1327750 RepID=UPI0025B292FC|nr:nitrate reductase molybdenum cofactor assembly chaperone [Aquisalimonas lutea]MDN3519366.1 nitrate reductase molybdenum cofactor assembly chaperone [Aquisalimonas lutea]